MQKSKHIRSLFDRLSEDGGEISSTLQQQSRWSTSTKSDGESTVGNSAESPETLRYVHQDDPATKSPLVLAGNRIELSLSPWAVAMVAAGLFVLLAAAFELGNRTGSRSGLRAGYQQGRASLAAESMTDLEAARVGPVADGLVADLHRSAKEQPAKVRMPRMSTPAADWTTGYTYVVAQGFTADQAADAEEVQRHLADRGIEVARVEYPSGVVHLITTIGFDRSHDAQRNAAEAFLKKIHRIGKQYLDAGGRYKLDGYFKTLTGDRW